MNFLGDYGDHKPKPRTLARIGFRRIVSVVNSDERPRKAADGTPIRVNAVERIGVAHNLSGHGVAARALRNVVMDRHATSESNAFREGGVADSFTGDGLTLSPCDSGGNPVEHLTPGRLGRTAGAADGLKGLSAAFAFSEPSSFRTLADRMAVDQGCHGQPSGCC